MEDSQIIKLYEQRAENAIVETKSKYGKYCKHIAFNILKTEEDAEECEHDTYLKTWNSIPPTSPVCLKAFIGKIVRNIAIQKYRYYHAEKRNQQVECIIEELDQCVSSAETVESQIEEMQLTTCIEQFLDTLSEEHRKLFLRRYWKAEPIKEICGQMKISKSKAETTLFRIRQKLKIHLEQEGYTL